MENKEYVLRGFIRLRPSGRFVGVCLRPNLVVEADSREEAFEKLKDLIGAYRADAVRDGELDHFMKQRAPFAFYLEWFSLRIAQFGHENWRNIRDVVCRLLHEQPNSSGPIPDAVGRPFRTFTEKVEPHLASCLAARGTRLSAT